MEFLLLLAFIVLTAVTVSQSTAGPISRGPQAISHTSKTKAVSLPADSSRLADGHVRVLADAE